MRVLCKALICKHGVVYLFDMVDIIYINKGLKNEHLVLSLFCTMWVRELKVDKEG